MNSIASSSFYLFKPELQKKIAGSMNIIQLAFADYGPKIGICFNGGKDSTVVLDLVHRFKKISKISTPIHPFFLDNNSNFAEVREFVKMSQEIWGTEVEILHGDDLRIGFQRLIEDNSMNSFFLGQRSTDPKSNSLTPFSPTTKPWPEAMRILPILNWSYTDVWTYIDTLQIPTCTLYSKGYSSIGTIKDTKPNESLCLKNGSYLHARLLGDPSKERAGRDK